MNHRPELLNKRLPTVLPTVNPRNEAQEDGGKTSKYNTQRIVKTSGHWINNYVIETCYK